MVELGPSVLFLASSVKSAPPFSCRDQVLGFLLGLHQDMARAHFRLGLQLGDLLVIGGLGLRLGDGLAHFLLVEGVAQRPQLVIGEPLLEILAGAELAFARFVREQVRLNEIFHEHAAAALDGEACDFRADFSLGESELGLGNIGIH